MTESAELSAAEQRRVERRREIQESACRLVIADGYDGFTMDDLAAEVGVSRRTLFNLVAGKEEAVLGPVEAREHVAFAAFRDGGPTGDLITDLRLTVRQVVAQEADDDPSAVARHELVERAVSADPKVLQMVNERFAQMADLAAEIVCSREGWDRDDLRAHTLAALLLATVRLALQRMTNGEGLLETFDEVFDALDSVLADHDPHRPTD